MSSSWLRADWASSSWGSNGVTADAGLREPSVEIGVAIGQPAQSVRLGPCSFPAFFEYTEAVQGLVSLCPGGPALQSNCQYLSIG